MSSKNPRQQKSSDKAKKASKVGHAAGSENAKTKPQKLSALDAAAKA